MSGPAAQKKDESSTGAVMLRVLLAFLPIVTVGIGWLTSRSIGNSTDIAVLDSRVTQIEGSRFTDRDARVLVTALETRLDQLELKLVRYESKIDEVLRRLKGRDDK